MICFFSVMQCLTLCRERLDRLKDVLDRQGGSETIRQLNRRFAIWEWEVEQAAVLGWVTIETRNPATGRPSRIARKLSQTPDGNSRRHAARLARQSATGTGISPSLPPVSRSKADADLLARLASHFSPTPRLI